ncbi:uncharacterized protein LOC144824699 isoform X2 [Lissotriton helveticus]
MGVYRCRIRYCQKRWQDLHGWTRKIARVQLKLSPPRKRGGRRTLTPHMLRILMVVFPDLDRQLKAKQQQGGGGDSSMEQEEAESQTGSIVEKEEGPRVTEGEGSPTKGRSETSTSAGDQESSSDDSLEVVAAPTSEESSSESATSPSTTSTLTSPPIPSVCGASCVRERVSFLPSTAPPASVPPAALSVEAVDLLKQLHVGQTSILSVLHAHTCILTQYGVIYEGHLIKHVCPTDMFQTMASSLMAAVSLLQQSLTPPSPAPSTLTTTLPDPSTLTQAHAYTETDPSSTQPPKTKLKKTVTHTQGTDIKHTGDKDKKLTHPSTRTTHSSPTSTSKTPTPHSQAKPLHRLSYSLILASSLVIQLTKLTRGN